MVGSTGRQSTQERCRGGHGQQAGTHRMGRTIEWTRLQTFADRLSRLK